MTTPSRTVVGTRAKKGDLVAYEIQHSATYLKGGTQVTLRYCIGLVRGADREGRITSYIDSRDYAHKGRPSKSWIVTAAQLGGADVAAIVKDAPEFESIDLAKAYIIRCKTEQGVTV